MLYAAICAPTGEPEGLPGILYDRTPNREARSTHPEPLIYRFP
jgi:hypothetical protein